MTFHDACERPLRNPGRRRLPHAAPLPLGGGLGGGVTGARAWQDAASLQRPPTPPLTPPPRGGGFPGILDQIRFAAFRRTIHFRRGGPHSITRCAEDSKWREFRRSFCTTGRALSRVGKTGQPSVFPAYSPETDRQRRAKVEDVYPIFAKSATRRAWRSGSPMSPKALRGGALAEAQLRRGWPSRQFFAKDRTVCLGQENGPTSCFSTPFAGIGY